MPGIGTVSTISGVSCNGRGSRDVEHDEEVAMKAVLLSGYGDANELQLRDVPDAHAPRDGIAVRMAGASINPIDWKMRSGAAKARFPVTFPVVLGRDASGEVIEVGADVKGFAKGDRVMGLVWGAYAELVAAPADSWAKVPAGFDLADAGALPHVLLTGGQLAEEAVNASPGDTVLVTGATGSVGRAAVFGAKSRGAKVLAGVRKAYREEAARLGADGVFALDDEADLARLPVLGAIADTVGGETTQKLLGKLRPGGTIGSVVGEPAGAKDRGFVVRAFMARPDPAMLARYGAAVAEGKVAVPIAQRLPLAQAAEAHRLAEGGHPGGKVLLLG
jgi:NADPH:quinone reductase-like Zn-dependent oxidoreductase